METSSFGHEQERVMNSVVDRRSATVSWLYHSIHN